MLLLAMVKFYVLGYPIVYTIVCCLDMGQLNTTKLIVRLIMTLWHYYYYYYY